tara:strand:+ start:1039 stop:1722 length:684 start_codon:yes stop_codon:yes gene_type:complete
MQKIAIKQVCNLSRLPISIKKNPCYKTVKQLLKADIDFKETELYRHYNEYNPKTLADIYEIDDEALSKASYNSIFLPWLHTKPVKKYQDQAYINRENDYIIKQVDKIKDLISSIKEHGYTPEKFQDRKGGYITGYYLQNDGEKKFYVNSGNHRTSIVSALFPKRKIPVKYEKYEFLKERDLINVDTELIKNFPPIFDASNIENWPAVKSGFLKVQVAQKIIDRYFEE